MSNETMQPMRFGEIVDRTFQVYRRHFGKVFLLMLVLIAPLHLLQDYLLQMFNTSFLPNFGNMRSFEDYLTGLGATLEPQGEGSLLNMMLVMFFVIPLLYVVFYPLAASSITFLVESTLMHRNMSFAEMLKKPFDRFWAILGNSLLYGLILLGISIAFFVLFFLMVLPVTFSFGVGMEHMDSFMIGLVMFFVILGIMLLAMLAFSFFVLRWGFYLPVVVLQRKGVGLGPSWNMTRKNFWRLFAVFLLILIIYTVISSGASFITLLIFGASIVGQLLQNVIFLLTLPILMIVYALLYIDLLIRKEGIDLENILDS